MKLSILIPAYNEKKTILEILKRIDKVVLAVEKEIVIVDDYSIDGTRDILSALDSSRYKVVLQEKNSGKGAAIRAGLREATGDLVIFQDADLEYDPEDYRAMIQPILDGKTEVVLGVRVYANRDKIKYRSLYYFISWCGGELITWTTNILFRNHAGEYEGCYKAFTKRLLDTVEIKANGFEIDNELVCKILKKGYKTVDVPIGYFPRSYEEGKHIRWKDGLIILWTIVKYRFVD